MVSQTDKKALKQSKLSILIFSVTPSPYQRDFFKALAARSACEVKVVYFEKAPAEAPWEMAMLEPWESVLPGFSFGIGRYQTHLNWRLPDYRPYDAVIVNAPVTSLTAQYLFRRLGRNNDATWFFWAELLRAHTGWRLIAQNFLIKPIATAKGIVAIGKKAQADYSIKFPNLDIRNIPYACNLDAYRPDRGKTGAEKPQPFRFLYAGQMIHRKGVDVLVKAFERLIESGMELELDLVGTEGFLEEYTQLLSNPAKKRLTYHGFQQPDALPPIFQQADAFVLASRHDGWGVVVNQALGAGLPVISTSAVGAGTDLIRDGVNGYLVKPGDVTALASAMALLAGDRAKLSEMSAEALRTAEKISPEHAAAQWLEVLFAQND